MSEPCLEPCPYHICVEMTKAGMCRHEVATLKARIAQLEQERDAAVTERDNLEVTMIAVLDAALQSPVEVPLDMSLEFARVVNAVRINSVMRERATKERDEARESCAHAMDGRETINADRTELMCANTELGAKLAEQRHLTMREMGGLIDATAEQIAKYVLSGEVANAFDVDLTDPNCPRGTALTVLATNITEHAWRTK